MLVSIRPASAEAAMSSYQYLREFIKERLTAVCEEIFSEVQKTIVQYEEEINRQHRLLDISRKPDRNSHIIVPEDLPQQHDCVENESVDEQQVCNQEMNSSLIFFQIKEEQEDPEPPQIKEEQEELCSSQEGEQLGLKQEADTFMVTLTYEQSDHSEPEPNSEQFLPLSSPEADLKKRTDHSKSLDDTLVSDIQSKTHTRKNSVQCNTCGKMFPYRSHLITHLRVHTDPLQQHDCKEEEDPEAPQINKEQEELCSSQEGEQLGLMETICKPDIKLHRIDLQQQHVGEKEEGLDEQQVCNQERNSSLDQEEPEPPQVKEEQEELCSSQEGEQLGLKQEADTLADNTAASESQTETREKSLQCDTCGKTFQYKCLLTAHLTVHTGEKPYFCSICEKRFIRKIQLKNHMRIHTGEYPYSCNSCGEKFIDLSTLKAHVRIHTGEKSYPCSTCGKEFSQKSALKSHVRVHTGEKRHCCSTCGESFIWNMQLIRHMRIHTGEKPYFCSTCEKRFIRKIQLKNHMRIHTGEDPYSCNSCGEKFIDLSTLKAHVRIHTREKSYPCSTCGKEFSQKSALKSHVRVHTGEKRHFCSTCGESFIWNMQLIRHRRIHTDKQFHG
ncbi:zinc finger protein ZFP2-like isoform X1 [Pelmatolapia mariae]|uniref:zinc finger protein ZFP2-like isoform X1 n=2 Tax=Pelmatolapia mariae TaxID=158779 RepID=UPI002FE522CC